MIFEISKENESIFLLNFSKIHKAPEWMLLPFKKKFLRNKRSPKPNTPAQLPIAIGTLIN